MSRQCISRGLLAIVVAAFAVSARGAETSSPDEEHLLFTPPGFSAVGQALTADPEHSGRLTIRVIDEATGEPTPCRINVVGPDGNFYQPKTNYLTPYGLTGKWPEYGRGNRQGKGPFRYFGRYFYSWGEATVDVPPGDVRVEVWKGIEFRPAVVMTKSSLGKTQPVEVRIANPAQIGKAGYYSGDPHLHFERRTFSDEQMILDLMQAEDIHYGTILAYNDPAGPYQGFMKWLDMPQYRGMGKSSILSRDAYHIVSGQEYRSTTYGHMNLFLRDDIVYRDKDFNADNWPLYGHVARETMDRGGYAFYAHGGYAQSIYADFPQGNVNAVELLQFAVYRGIELGGWYDILNIGYRFPAVGACDFPACRKLGDCMTYVHHDGPPTIEQWLAAASAGNSFITTGPMLLLEVDGKQPGAVINHADAEPHSHAAKIRVTSEVTPITRVQLVANGEIVKQWDVPEDQRQGKWLEFDHPISVTEGTWVAARAFGLSPAGNADAESHTNPVYIGVNGKAPYRRDSIDRIIERLDGQIAIHKKRDFAEKADVLAYFERSRDILLAIRETGGVPIEGHPAESVRASLPELNDPGARAHTDDELKAYLKPVPPRSPEEALKTFETLDGFEMQLVAHEPQVYSPIAAEFDEDGNLYVAEMIDYPYYPKPGDKPLGTIRKLRDTDGDGDFDEAHVFADELLWAGGVAPWKGGVFVCAPPDIWYFQDTNGDHVADVRKKIFTGFGVENQQAMLNNLKHGLDHWIYGSTAGNGGTIRRADQPNAAPIKADGMDFRFHPETLEFETITGTVQFGNSFDDWGNRFVCNQSQPAKHVVLPHEYLVRNPYLPIPSGINDIAGESVPIFRISPIERWRHIRSSRRIAHQERGANQSGASHHVVDAGAGVTVFRGGAYPPEFYGTIFTGDAQNNLVHRRILEPSGVTFTTRRADEKAEFVRSSDNWFRPVNFINAPDGTLYVVDMCREILESIHIPLDVLKHIDLKSGRDRGRIYRVAPRGFRSPAPPNLSVATTVELVAALESPHGWWRETAHRLIYERQDRAAAPMLRELLTKSASPQARLHALWSLDGLDALADNDLLTAMADAHFEIRAHAIKLAESRFDASPALREATLHLAGDEHPRVRFQTAFSLGETRDPRATDALAAIARRDGGDIWTRTAVLSSCEESSHRMFGLLAEDKPFADSAAAGEILDQLARVAGVRRKPDEIDAVLNTLSQRAGDVAGDAFTVRALLSLGSGIKQSGGRFGAVETDGESNGTRFLTRQLAWAKTAATDERVDEALRVRGIELLACAEFPRVRDTLAGLLAPKQPQTVQLASVRALAGYPDAESVRMLLAGWEQATPETRAELIKSCLSRDTWTTAFLEAATREETSLAQIDAPQRALLQQHRNESIRQLAAKLLGDGASQSRKAVIAEYQPALNLNGTEAAGKLVFEKTCMGCHKIGDTGVAIGPDLTSSPSRDPGALLMHILDPNQYVLPNYTQYIIVDQNGVSYTGMIASQSATSVTLVREKQATDTILRSHIDEMVSTGKSLMPEGVEKTVTLQDMADLIAFLRAAQSRVPTPEPRLDIGTEPGLVEPD